MSEAPPRCASPEAAVALLEELDLCALADDPCRMAEAMIVRQHALDYLRERPLSALPEAARALLRGRLERVLERDAEAMTLLREAHASIGEQLGGVVSGRRAARGYGSVHGDASSASVKRVG